MLSLNFQYALTGADHFWRSHSCPSGFTYTSPPRACILSTSTLKAGPIRHPSTYQPHSWSALAQWPKYTYSSQPHHKNKPEPVLSPKPLYCSSVHDGTQIHRHLCSGYPQAWIWQWIPLRLPCSIHDILFCCYSGGTRWAYAQRSQNPRKTPSPWLLPEIHVLSLFPSNYLILRWQTVLSEILLHN